MCCFNGTNEVFTRKFPASINAVGRFNVVVRDMTVPYIAAEIKAKAEKAEKDRLEAEKKPAAPATASANSIRTTNAIRTSTASPSDVKPAEVSPNVVIEEPQWLPVAIFGAVKKGTMPIGKPFSMGSLSQAIPTN